MDDENPREVVERFWSKRIVHGDVRAWIDRYVFINQEIGAVTSDETEITVQATRTQGWLDITLDEARTLIGTLTELLELTEQKHLTRRTEPGQPEVDA
ncbi:hypothetical protein D9V30_05200 [Mycetocola reblochoni]|uniref:Uncharacterized protein n=1 Tax=Mycetocola reblochoni TaxID=331618 RepID=A0A3L6ZQ44_9MICO|nr:hypothetical protein D9V30_05200 [Mycetocola reblochoni]